MRWGIRWFPQQFSFGSDNGGSDEQSDEDAGLAPGKAAKMAKMLAAKAANVAKK